MDGRSLSETWRTAQTPYLSWRRGVVLTSFAAGLSMMAIGLYQTGIIVTPGWCS
jgi:hypothetical protein